VVFEAQIADDALPQFFQPGWRRVNVKLLVANAALHRLDDCWMGLCVIGVLTHPAQAWSIDQAIEMGVSNLKRLHCDSKLEALPWYARF
jgi:hypothetical protein